MTDPRLTTARGLTEYALHLRMYGENAPGGDETWAEWDRAADAFMRVMPSDSGRQGIEAPDADLLAAVYLAVHAAVVPAVPIVAQSAIDAAASAALAAVGRALADLLRAEAKSLHADSEFRLASGVRESAWMVARWCGVPEAEKEAHHG